MPAQSEIEHDIMSHFATRHARAGSAFDLKGFWRLTIPKYLLRDEDFEGAMRNLVATGIVEPRSARYHLTAKGAEQVLAPAPPDDPVRR